MKAKHTTKKVLSLLLAAMMVLTMIPFGMMATFAEGTDGALEIKDTDAADATYVIYGLTDWATVQTASTAGNTFAGKTVKLGADITGVTTTLFNDFAGTFDGDGHKISGTVPQEAVLALSLSGNAVVTNVTFENVTQSKALQYTSTIATNTAAESNVTISNIAFKNVTVTINKNYINSGLLVGDVVGSSISVDNIDLDNVTVKTTNGTNNDKFLGILIGTMKAGADSTINDITASGTVTVSTSKLHKGGVGGLIGGFRPSASAKLTISNVNIPNINVYGGMAMGGVSSGTTSNRERNGIGGIIGDCRVQDETELTLENIKIGGVIEGEKTTGNNGTLHTGGLIGRYTSASANGFTAFDTYAGTLNIKNVEMLANVTSTATQAYCGTAGLIGTYGQRGQGVGDSVLNYAQDQHAKDAVLNIENVVVAGNISGANEGGTSGVIGYSAISTTTVNIKNILITGTISSTDTDRVGIILGKGLRLGWNATVLNCSTVAANDSIDFFGHLGEQKGYGYNSETEAYALTAPTITLNGKAYTAGTDFTDGMFNLQRSSLAVVSETEAAALINRGTTFIESVEGHLEGSYEQHTEVYEKNGTKYYDIRFVTLVHVDDAESFEVTVRAKTLASDTDDDTLFDRLPCDAYSQLVGYENDLAAYQYTPAELNGRSFIAVVLSEIEVGVDYDFDVTASYTTADGVTMTDIVRTLRVTWEGDTPTFSSTPIVK